MQAALFITCLTDTFCPRVGVALVRVLRHFGWTVVLPRGQTCCGQPAFNSGAHADARPLARRMISLFADQPHVVTPSASCAAMFTHHYAELLGSDPVWGPRATALAGRTHECLTFLRDVVGVDVSSHLRFDEPVTFHYSCHARGAYGPAELERWLAAVPGIDLRPPPQRDLCCGFGGVFAIEFPEISGAMLDDKLADLTATGARLVICNEGGCGLHLTGGAARQGVPLRFKHLIECLAESLNLLRPDELLVTPQACDCAAPARTPA
jgi:L-lactate dehydrogenase complex protein LldE